MCDVFRGSVDELLVHPFIKHPKKISNDPQHLAGDMAKILSIYKQEELTHNETNIDPIFGKTSTKAFDQ